MTGASTEPRLVIVAADVFADTAARWIADRLERAVAARGRASIALAGGGTPAPVYRRLAAVAPDWSRVHVYFGDERRVPADDAASNYRMAREMLLDRLAMAPAGVHRMRGEDPDGDAAAAAYEAELPGALDIVVLGMGEDAHTASLFPRSPALEETVRRVLAVPGPPAGPPRITLTPPAIAAARDRLVLVAGAGKAVTVAEALEGERDVSRRPVQLALDGTWILDEGAARALTRGA